jgi:hypothetical protein
MFEPWTGPNYERSRLLLLGESAHSWGDGSEHPSPRHSIELVEETIPDFAKATGFMRTLTRGIAGEETPDRAARAAAWNRVAFTNYVSGTVGDAARVRPASEMWQTAYEEFPALLDLLQPRTIIVLGLDMWERMPPTSLHLTKDVQGYRLKDGGMAMCWALNHPSAGLSWHRLSNVIAFAVFAAGAPALTAGDATNS